MYKRILSLLGITLFFASSSFAFAEEVIDSFDVRAVINSDATVDITEQIEYDFTDEEKRGIFRDIPYLYSGFLFKQKYNISDISVVDSQGQPHTYTTSKSGGVLQIRIGDADKTVTGKQTYVISYSVDRALGYFDTFDELYWNATGNNWPVSIMSSSARVVLPQALSDDQIQTACYAGYSGMNEPCNVLVEDAQTVVFFPERALEAGEGFTFAIGFPKGIVSSLSFIEKAVYFVKDNFLVLLFLPLPFIVFVIMFRRWHRYGRDPKINNAIVAEYDAPDTLTPIESALILRHRITDKDISSEIISLAVRGYLKITRLEEGLLKKDDYQFDKLKELSDSGSDVLKDFDKKLFQEIFKESNSVKVSSFKNTFYTKLPTIKSAVAVSVTTGGYFKENPDIVRRRYAILVVVGFFAVFVSFFFSAFLQSFVILLSVLPAVVIYSVFAYLMPSLSEKGARVKHHIKGLKEYLQIAEKDRINFHNAPEKSIGIFEKLLPFAMMLGVEKAWAKEFEGMYKNPPTWYNDSSLSGLNSFNSLAFISSINSFSSSASSSLSSAPGSSSGSSGGGSSGGGGGGGGGGSW